MEKGFTYLNQGQATLKWSLYYSGGDNITGRPLAGYNKNVLVGTMALSGGIQMAAAKAAAKGLQLFVFDAYRPQKAVDELVRWAGEKEDWRTKEKFYPNIAKADIIHLGYIAEKSGHSRGSVVDLTFMSQSGHRVDMGTAFDFMDVKSHHGADGISGEAAQNRALLRSIMEQSGFEAYEREWWHYRLKEEPFPRQYFDFDIE